MVYLLIQLRRPKKPPPGGGRSSRAARREGVIERRSLPPHPARIFDACHPPPPGEGLKYSPIASAPSRARRRGEPSSPASTIIAATNRAVSVCWPNSASASRSEEHTS